MQSRPLSERAERERVLREKESPRKGVEDAPPWLGGHLAHEDNSWGVLETSRLTLSRFHCERASRARASSINARLRLHLGSQRRLFKAERRTESGFRTS